MEVVNKRLFEIEKTSFALLNLFQEMSISMEAGFDRMAGRINRLELQLTNMESRIDQLEIRTGRLETKIDEVANGLTEITMMINQGMISVSAGKRK